MADELERSRLTVELVPQKQRTNAAGKVRRAVERNPDWYRRFCASHTSTRKDGFRWRIHKTAVKRAMTIRSLRALAEGRKQRTMHFGPPLYAKWLKPVIRAEMKAAKEREAAEWASVLAEVPF